MAMNPEAEAHLESLNRDFCEHNNRKYRLGNKEHGGDMIAIDAITLLENALDEVVDLHNYLRDALREEYKRRDREQNNFMEYEAVKDNA